MFVEAKFPNYERFWQTFTVPRIKHAKYFTTDFDILDDVPRYERRIVTLNYRVFIALYQVYRSLEKKQGTPSRERWDFRDAVSHLVAACDRVDQLLFLSLIITNKLPEDSPVRQTYLQRRADHRAAIKAANAPYEGRKISLDENPPFIPGIPDLLPTELAATREHFNLTDFDPIASRIRNYKEAVNALHAANRQYWYKDYDKHIAPKLTAEDQPAAQAAAEASDAGLKTILGDHPTMRDLTRELADSLTAEIDKIWGSQLLPLVNRYAKAQAEEHANPV